MERVLIGAAWPYVNGPQHMGHLAGNLLPADIFARYQRSRGNEVLFVSGSDMHGTPTALRAELEGVSPEELARKFHEIDKVSFERLGLSFDLYTHTHTPTHERTVQEIFLTLLEKRYLEKRTEDSPYCAKEDRFLPDRYVTGTCPHCGNPSARGDECSACARVLEARELGNPTCKVCGSPAIFRPSEQFYFLLPKLASEIKAYHDSVKEHWRPSVRAFTENYLAAGLRPRPITRDINWGVPVPLEGYSSKRIYVWFEAVIGYLSAAQEWAARTGNPDGWKRFWAASEPGRVYNFLGKDNITFHTVLWPAILIAVGGLKLPYDVPANEFVNLSGSRISKSDTTGKAASPIFLPELLDLYEPEALRFYAAYHAPQNHDSEFNLDELTHERDQILADQWGNLVQRVLSFAKSQLGNRIPAPPSGWTPERSALVIRVRSTISKYEVELDRVQLKEGLETALDLVRESNRHFHESKPWSTEEASRNATVYETIWSIRALAVLLSPYLPFSCQKVAEMLGEPELAGSEGWRRLQDPPEAGRPLGQIVPLFPKERPASKAPAEPTPVPARLDVRVAIIREVSPHPNAERLYVLKLEDGTPTGRTLVAGLRPYYAPEELRGKHVAFLANLEPRTLRGIRSEGMLLAASAGPIVSIIRAQDSSRPGTGLVGAPTDATLISHEEFTRARLSIASGAVHVPGALQVVRNDAQGEAQVLRLTDGSVLFPDRDVPAGTSVA